MANAPPAQLSSFDEHLTEELPNHPDGYKQHVFLIKDGDKHQYLKLKLISAAPSNSLPNYSGNSAPINGSVELNLKKPTGVKLVSVSLKGLIVSSEIDTRPFIEQEVILINEKTDIDGVRSWPFSFSIPDTVTFEAKKADSLGLDIKPNTAYPLPPSLRSTTFSTMVDYVVSVTVKYSSIFTPDDSISTLIGYVPSNLQSHTISNNGATSGWADFESKLEGTAFGERKVDVNLKLSLPSPAVFNSGSTIPVRMTISSSDAQVLDLLAQPDVPVAELTYRFKTSPGLASYGSALVWRNLQDIPRVVWRGTKEVTDEDDFERSERSLEGQIEIQKSIQPSFSFGALASYYTFDITPLKTAGFEPSSKELIFNIPVTIA